MVLTIIILLVILINFMSPLSYEDIIGVTCENVIYPSRKLIHHQLYSTIYKKDSTVATNAKISKKMLKLFIKYTKKLQLSKCKKNLSKFIQLQVAKTSKNMSIIY